MEQNLSDLRRSNSGAVEAFPVNQNQLNERIKQVKEISDFSRTPLFPENTSLTRSQPSNGSDLDDYICELQGLYNDVNATFSVLNPSDVKDALDRVVGRSRPISVLGGERPLGGQCFSQSTSFGTKIPSSGSTSSSSGQYSSSSPRSSQYSPNSNRSGNYQGTPRSGTSNGGQQGSYNQSNSQESFSQSRTKNFPPHGGNQQNNFVQSPQNGNQTTKSGQTSSSNPATKPNSKPSTLNQVDFQPPQSPKFKSPPPPPPPRPNPYVPPPPPPPPPQKSQIPWEKILKVFAILLTAIIIGAILFFIGYSIYKSFYPDQGLEDSGEKEEHEPPEKLLNQALLLANSGNFLEAIRFLYSASYSLLDKNRVFEFDDSWTNREALRKLELNKKIHAIMKDMTEIFDPAYYGKLIVNKTQFEMFHRKFSELKSQNKQET